MAYIVKQPAANGKINIFIAENHHCPEKRGARQSRIYIGGLDAVTGELLLAAKRAEPDAELSALLAKKGIVYNGKRSEPTGRKRIRPIRTVPASASAAVIGQAKVTEVGRVDAFRHLADESGLSEALREAYGEALGRRILNAATFQACEGSPLYLAGEWADETGLGDGLSSASLSRAAADIGKDAISMDQFFSLWIKACGFPKVVIHDTTSFSSYSDGLDLLEWGYNRDKEALPQLNFAMVVSRDRGRPLWFRVVPGSIPDVATLKVTKKELMALGLCDFKFALDRGYFSESNLIDLKSSKVGFTLGAPTTSKAAQRLIHDSAATLATPGSSFIYRGKRLRHVPGEYRIEGEDKLKSVPAHVFLNPEQREELMARLEMGLLEFEDKVSTKWFNSPETLTAWLKTNAKGLAKYLMPVASGKRWKIGRNLEAIARASESLGVALILADTAGTPPKDVLDEYRCRDIAEKIFDTTKNGIGANRIRTGDADQAKGRLFLSFVAVILRTLFETKMREADLLTKHSVDEAIAMLRKIKVLRLRDGSTVACEIPKKARLIMKAIEKTLSTTDGR